MSWTRKKMLTDGNGKPIPQVYDASTDEFKAKTIDPEQVVMKGNNTQIYDGTVSWANSDVAGTVKTADVALPTDLQVEAFYEIIITNPSTETALSVSVKNKETFGTTAKYPELTTLSIPVSTPDGKVTVVQGWLLGEAGRLTLSNDTGIGLTGAFTAEIRVRKI